MSAAIKRGRASAANYAHDASPTPAASRQDNIDRLDKLLNPWTEAASIYGVLPQLDVVLCASGKHIARSLQSVTEAAEAAKQKLERIRATLHAAVDRRIDVLLAATSAAESVKIAALESELEKLDESLERTRREHAAARTATTTFDDSAFAAARGDMVVQLDELNALIFVVADRSR
jgi:phosphoglycolate phosphatase-like HAD superfamily hydrolase